METQRYPSKRKRHKFLAVVLIFAIVISMFSIIAYAAAPLSEDYQSYSGELIPAPDGSFVWYNAPKELGDWRYSILNSDGSNSGSPEPIGLASQMTNGSVLCVGNNIGLQVLGWYDPIGITDRYFQAKPKDGSVFRLVSFDFETNTPDSLQFKVIGYKDGSTVLGAEQIFTANWEGVYHCMLSGTAWQNIDEFRIVALDGSGAEYSDLAFYLDNLTVSEPLLPDTTPPDAPMITGFSEDTGSSSTDRTTNDTTPTLAGTTEANSTIIVYRDGVLSGAATADSSGSWSFTSTTLSDGTYHFTASAADAAGNISVPSAAYSITIDTTTPSVSGISDNTSYHTGQTASFTEGTATLVKDSGTPIPYPSGTTISEDGSYILVVTDVAGNSTTVRFTINTNKTLTGITAPTAITGVANGATKTAAALELPAKVMLETDDGDVQADVTWDVSSCSYDPSDTSEQNFTVDGTVTLPNGVDNPSSIPLDVSIDVTVSAKASTYKTLTGITVPTAIAGVANGTTKTAAALRLPKKVTLETDDGDVQADVTWDVSSCSYDPSDTSEQNFTVGGTVTLPSGVDNPSSIPLDVSIDVTVSAKASTDKTLTGITAPTAITGVANGTTKTAAALGLPKKVTLETDDGDVQADVTWDVSSCSYDPSDTSEQNFTVDGTATLPSGVINPDGVSLEISIDVTVNAKASTDKTLTGITAPTAITGVANGTAKTAAALGLPAKVTLETDDGDVQVDVTWNVSSCSYNPSNSAEQNFIVDGIVTLPSGVINPNHLPLTTSISVSVKKASRSGGSSSGHSSSGSGNPTVTTVTTSERKPDQPVTVEASVTATIGKNGTAGATIPDKVITDAIAEAQTKADAQGKTANGISVTLNITISGGTTASSATLSQTALKALTDASVTSLEINGFPARISFNQKALREIRAQSNNNVIISAVSRQNLSTQSRTMIGTRPVYNITVGYISNSSASTVMNLGSDTATVYLPYTPAKGESAGYLYGVYVDGNGNATRIGDSAYDANSGCLIFNTNHFSVYGIGYTAPSAKFTDVGSHWAKDSIDYVAGRGLIDGISNTKFSPDTAISRGILVTALGRLANVDTKLYTTSSFTDVKVGSTYQPYIEWACQKGIIQGTGNNQFSPDQPITREEIAVILQNYAKAAGYPLPVTREAVTYADTGNIGSNYKDAVKALQQAGIMVSANNNQFNPKSNATRAEVSAMLYRYIKLTIDPATAQGWAKNDSGQWMYFKDGKALTGWQNVSSKVYCFDSSGGAYTNGWRKNDKDEWFNLSSDGSAVIV